METNLYAVDVETSGLDPNTCAILSIGAVELNSPSRTFYEESSGFQGADIQEGALKVNGFTLEQISKQPIDESRMLQRFFAWLKKNPIMVAHNSAFDSSFIKAAAVRASLPNPFSFRTIDIHSIVYMNLMQHKKEIPAKLSLNECLSQYSLPREPDPHNALTGAQCNQSLFEAVYFNKLDS